MDVMEPDTRYLVRPKSLRTELSNVPPEWEIVSLFALADGMKERFDDGDWIEAEHLRPSGIRLIQTGNIGIGAFIDKASKKYISENSFELLRCKRLREGDLLICRLAEPAGRACIFPKLEEDKAVTAVDVTIFRPAAERVDRRYLLHVFSTIAWLSAVSERCGGSTRSRIARGALGKISVPVPSIIEQSAIADALSDADALIESLEQLLAKKRQIKQGAMQELLTGKKRLLGFTGNWQVQTLREVASVKTGPFGSALHESDYADSGTPIITVEHLGERGVRHSNLPLVNDADRQRLSAYALEAGDIVFSRVGSVDRNALIQPSEAGWLFSGRLLRVRLDRQVVFAPFLSFFFRTEKFVAQIKSVAVGQTMASLNTKILSSVEIRFPCVSEQESIARILSDMDADLAALEARLAKARRIKQGMMQALLTGRIRLV